MKLIMCKGLSGSGKSTWAREFIAKNPNYKIVNKDSLRKMLDNSRWSKDNEKFVIMVRDNIILEVLDRGLGIIVDDTNLAPKHEIRLRELAELSEAEFSIQDFTDVPIETCIANDLKRLESVGEQVIRKQYNQFLAPKPVTQEWNPDLPTAILCDMDGTLALFDGNPYDRDFSQDKLNNPIKQILWQFDSDTSDYETTIILLSGRKDKFRSVTEEWLGENAVPYDYLFMRATDDNRKDFIIKEEIYNAEIKGKYNVLFVLDDRDQVVSLWRRLGLTCLQVAYGAF